jgi:hypothetical protein
MVDVVGPLFSLAASGTFRKAIVFSKRNGKTVVSAPPITNVERSPEQILHTTKIREMSGVWKAITPASKILWTINATSYDGNGYRYFWAEWFLQNSTTANPPVLP